MAQRIPLKRCFMCLRKYPYLVRRPRRIRTARDKIADLFDDPAALPQLLRQDVAKDAALFLAVIVLARAKLVQHSPRDERARRQLRRGMRKILTCHCAMVLEDGDVLEPLVSFQVLYPLRCQSQKALYFRVAGIPELMIVLWVFDQHLVRADRTHPVVDAVTF